METGLENLCIITTGRGVTIGEFAETFVRLSQVGITAAQLSEDLMCKELPLDQHQRLLNKAAQTTKSYFDLISDIKYLITKGYSKDGAVETVLGCDNS